MCFCNFICFSAIMQTRRRVMEIRLSIRESALAPHCDRGEQRGSGAGLWIQSGEQAAPSKIWLGNHVKKNIPWTSRRGSWIRWKTVQTVPQMALGARLGRPKRAVERRRGSIGGLWRGKERPGSLAPVRLTGFGMIFEAKISSDEAERRR